MEQMNNSFIVHPIGCLDLSNSRTVPGGQRSNQTKAGRRRARDSVDTTCEWFYCFSVSLATRNVSHRVEPFCSCRCRFTVETVASVGTREFIFPSATTNQTIDSRSVYACLWVRAVCVCRLRVYTIYCACVCVRTRYNTIIY